MKYYFIDIGFTANVAVEEHHKGAFAVDSNVKLSKSTAKKEYLKQLKTLAKELNDAILYIEEADYDYIPPVLLNSIHGTDNRAIDNEHNTQTFGMI